MSNDTNHRPVLDQLIDSRELQMIKAIVPYLYEPQKRIISLGIKLIELQKTLQLFDQEAEMQATELHMCENETFSERMEQMLNAIMEFCTPQEQERLSNILNVLDMFSAYALFQSDFQPQPE